MAMDGKDNSIRDGHVIEQISAYLDNALEVGERERVRAHIATCEVCGRELRELQATQYMLRALPVQVPPRVFTLTAEMVGAKPRSEAAPSLWSRLFGRALAPRLATGSVLAFTLLLVMLISDLGVLNRGGTSMSEAPTAAFRAESDSPDNLRQEALGGPTATTATAEMDALVAPSVAPEPPNVGGGDTGAGGTTPANPASDATPIADMAEATVTTGAEVPAVAPAQKEPTAQAAQDPAADQAAGAQTEGTALAYYDRQAPPGEEGESGQVPVARSASPSGTAMPVTLVIELGLALLGVGLAIGAILARRRSA